MDAAVVAVDKVLDNVFRLAEEATMKCQQQAVFRYTWPGRDEACICLEHAMQMRGVSEAMGFKLQFIPLSGQEQMTATCSQNVKEEAK